MATPKALQRKFAHIWPHLDERACRLVAATEARELGYGGGALVSRACGLSRLTIAKGIRELAGDPLPPGRVRRSGAGRPQLIVQDPALPERLEALVEPLARGDPWSPLRWTCRRGHGSVETENHRPARPALLGPGRTNRPAGPEKCRETLA